ncbi:hypothetical protein U9M48_039535 [Paspalum notatum var. saurae]|uniref:Uncharacterized protein n=1 Tax=Paspalum notatum var. saurae TaxID=547442 RepID=A0AAQ3XCT5_PASNO
MDERGNTSHSRGPVRVALISCGSSSLLSSLPVSHRLAPCHRPPPSQRATGSRLPRAPSAPRQLAPLAPGSSHRRPPPAGQPAPLPPLARQPAEPAPAAWAARADGPHSPPPPQAASTEPLPPRAARGSACPLRLPQGHSRSTL